MQLEAGFKKYLKCVMSNMNYSLKNTLGPYSRNFFSQIHKFFVTLGLNILRFLRLKFFLKQISLGDYVTSNINKNIYFLSVTASLFFLKLLKIQKYAVRGHSNNTWHSRGGGGGPTKCKKDFFYFFNAALNAFGSN